MKRLFAVLSACILVLVLGVGSGYLIVNRLVPALMSEEEPAESDKPPRVYERTGDEERELAPANLWLHRQYIMTVPKPDPTPTPIPAQVAAPEDFSPEASAVID